MSKTQESTCTPMVTNIVDVGLAIGSKQPNVAVHREEFPLYSHVEKFAPLFHMHGIEVRGRPFDLDWARYQHIQKSGRLVWVVARLPSGPVGYACGFWYRDLHFNERVATDDLWFVRPDIRGQGLGKALKLCAHAELKRHGAVRVYDNIRAKYDHPTLMRDIGFEPWGTRWVRTL